MLSLRSKVTRAILGYFFLHEDSRLYINEMSRRFRLDSGNLTRKLVELEKYGILKSEWQGSLRYYLLNREFPLFQEYKRIVQKTIGFQHRLEEVLRTVENIREAFIFGSFAQDQMDQNSDIDLMVIGDHGTIALQRQVAKLQKEIDREINCISMSPEEYRKKSKKDSFLKNIQKQKRIKINCAHGQTRGC